MKTTSTRAPRRALTINSIFLAVAVALGAAPAIAEPTPTPEEPAPTVAAVVDPTAAAFVSASEKTYPFRTGEKLIYDITVLGAVAGKGTLSVGKQREWNGKTVVPIHGVMTSTGFFDNVYPVSNKMASLLPLEGAYPLHTEMALAQNGATRVMKLDFDPEARKLAGTKNENNKGEREVKAKAPAYVQDALSWFYHLRTYPLTEGGKFTFKGYSGKFFYTVRCSVTGKEDVWTRLGMMPSYRIVADITRDGSKAFNRQVVFWVGTDSSKLPLKMSFEFTLGRVEGVLAHATVPPGGE